MHDDSFRTPGSPFEQEPVVAFAVVPVGAVVDWSDAGTPASTLWIPVSLFDELAEMTSLGLVERRGQSRLDVDACVALEEELMHLMAMPLPDEPRTAARRVLARVREVRPGARYELVIDGSDAG